MEAEKRYEWHRLGATLEGDSEWKDGGGDSLSPSVWKQHVCNSVRKPGHAGLCWTQRQDSGHSHPCWVTLGLHGSCVQRMAPIELQRKDTETIHELPEDAFLFS